MGKACNNQQGQCYKFQARDYQSKLFNCGYGAYGRNSSMLKAARGYRRGKV